MNSNRKGFLANWGVRKMLTPTKLYGRAQPHAPWLVATMLAVLVFASPVAIAGEGGTSHVMPGANATLMDLPPTSPGGFFKPMYINYRGDASATIPTAAGVVANLNADANTLVLGGGYGLEQTILGGAHYSIAASCPTPGSPSPAIPVRWAESGSRTACPASAT